MAQKPFRHVLVRHHLPGMRSALLGIALAILVLVTAVNCPVKGLETGACGSGVILLFIVAVLLVPGQIRHLWHTIEHSDMLYHVLSLAMAVAVLLYLPASGLVRVATAVAVFVGLSVLKVMIDRKLK